MMEIILASNNHHKMREFGRILKGHTLILPKDMGIDFKFEETGGSFLENAYGKAETLYSLIRKPVIADDSGLCVEALNGAPGVYSARYGSEFPGKELLASQRNSLLLSKMSHKQDRRAFFVCCMVLILEKYRFFIVQETLCGEITHSPKGTNGFGYDPVFFIASKGKTLAELNDDEKDEVSHRGKAARQLLKILS